MITDEAVAEFSMLTNASADEARGYLEMAGGELESAMNLFLEMGGGGGGGGSPAIAPAPAPAVSAPTAATSRSGGGPDADLAAEFAAVAAAAGIELPDAQMAEAEADVRAPIAAYQDQIINPDVERRRMNEAISADSAAMSRRMSFDRPTDMPGSGAGSGATAERPDADMDGPRTSNAINQLFAPPEYNNTKPYYEVIEQAKLDNKFVLVNIQQAEVFASHQLNRDVWSDDTIADIISGSFLFWQRDDKSTEGDQFCSYYQCGHQLPHICAIDPRTGRRVKAWDGRKWVESHAAAEYLFGFLDQYSMSRSPPSGSPPSGSPILKAQDIEIPKNGDMELVGLDDALAGIAAARTAAGSEDVTVADATPQETPAEAEAPAVAPPEPAESPECVKVSFRLPSGSRVTRRFLPSDPLEHMFACASQFAEQPMSKVDIATQYPKRSLRELEGGLSSAIKDAQVAGAMVMVSVRAS